jgi:hypothetical protein
MAKEWPVNRWCLLDKWDDTVAAAQAFSDDLHGAEPGPYYIFGVHRHVGV